MTPLGASTPTSRRIVDCCRDDISCIANIRFPSPNRALNETFNINDILHTPRSSTPSPLNFTSSLRNYVQDQLNRTYDWACSTPKANTTCADTCPKFAGSKRLNKSCEFRPNTRDSCEYANLKRVDFACMPNRSCGNDDVSHMFCKKCEDILNPAPGPSRHNEMSDKLCPGCKELVTPCQLDKTTILGKLYERCKELLRSVSSQTLKPCRHAEVEDKMCKKCLQILDSAPTTCVKSCRHLDVFDKLCKHCKYLVNSMPCRAKPPCTHGDDKTCGMCKDWSDVSPTCSKRMCEFVDKTCVIEPGTCDVACDPIDSAIHAFSKLIEVVDSSCEPFNVRQPTCVFVDKASDPCSFQSINLPSSTDSSDSKGKKKGKKEKKPKNKKLKKSDSSVKASCSKTCDATPFEPIKVIKIKQLCKSCKAKHSSKEYIDSGCCPIVIEKPQCILEDKACDAAPFQSIRTSSVNTSCQTEPCVKVDNICESKKFTLVDTGCDPAPFQSINLQDKGCDSLSFILKPCKHVRLQVSKKERCRSYEELFGEEAVEPVGCSTPEPRKSINVARSTSCHIPKDSMCRSSGPESPDSSCATARARYYQNKLLATLQILQNKEETVRVQAESLAVAEARITSLSARHADLRREIERKEREIQCLSKSLKEFKHGTSKMQPFDVSMTAQDMECRANIVTTLQNNLDVIEDLYRESFYETVKQENLIEMLRQSNLDIRLMEKDKSECITKLHNVINTQQWSLDSCQDIAADVENLKMEISNFINSSNNDSGVWEETVVGGLNEDLQDIAAQLMRLRDLLANDCTCGLDEENKSLKRNSEKMENEISDLRAKICALDANSRNNSIQGSCMEKQYQEMIANKDIEISCMREQLHQAMHQAEQKSSSYDMISSQISQTRASLDEKTAELSSIQKQCRIYEETIRVMKEELSKADQIAKENVSLRTELCAVSRRAARMQRRAADLEGELARARAHCEAVSGAYRDKMANAVELERQLDEAHARGAELCAEAGRVVRAVRGWAARMKDMHRDQQKQIKEKETRLRSLQRELDQRQSEICPRVWEQREQCCSPQPSNTDVGPSRNKCVRINECHDVRQRREDAGVSSASEMASCSTSPPCTPKRTCLKKKPVAVASSSGIRHRYGWLGPFCSQRDASAQRESTRHCASCDSCSAWRETDDLCTLTPGEEMFSRMERLSEALADGYKRWTRRTAS